jgi:uncharacterized repeat protein (TIGR01451 family)
MPHKTRFLFLFILLFAVGLAISLGKAPVANGQAAFADVAVCSPPFTTVPCAPGTANFTEAGLTNQFVIQVRELGGLAVTPPGAGHFSITFTLPAGITLKGAPFTTGNWACNNVGQNVTCNYPNATNIPANDNENATIPVDVASSALTSGNFNVSISIGANETTNTINNTYSQPYTVTTVPNLIISRVDHSGNSVPGNNADFIVGTPGIIRVTVRDSGNAPTTVATVTTDITIPAQLTNTTTTTGIWGCSNITATLVRCTTTTPIQPGAGNQQDIILTVNPTATGAGLTVSATVSGGGEPAAYNDAGNTGSESSLNIVGNPQLAVTKTHTGNFLAGTNQVYRFVVTNNGTGPTTGPITLTDTLPGGMTYVSFVTVPPGGSFNCSASAGANISCTRNVALAQGGGSETIDVTVAVPIGAPSPVTNSVTVTTAGSAPATANDPTTIQSVTIGVSKSHVDPFVAGKPAKYTIVVTNTGSAATPTATGSIVVKDTLPAGITFVSSSAPLADFVCVGAGTPVVVTCTSQSPFSIPANVGTYSFDINVGIGLTAVSGGVNSVQVIATGSPTANATDPLPTTIQRADLVITKTASNPFQVGIAGGSYTIHVTNNGSGPLPAATVVTVTDTLNASTPYNTDTGWPGAPVCTGAPNLSCQITLAADLAPGASLPDLVITVDPASATTVSNTATVTESANVDNTTPDTSTITTTVTAAPVADLDIVKAATIGGAPTASFTVGAANQEYTITVRNTSVITAAANTVTVTDNLPGGITIGAITPPAGWTCNTASAPTITCTNTTGAITGGTSVNIVLPITVGAAAVPSVTNNVQVAPSDPTPTDNQFPLTTPVNPAAQPDLTITKSHVGNFIKSSTPNTYTITVTNSGAADTLPGDTISVVDTLPAGFVFVGYTGPGGAWTPACCTGNAVTFTAAAGTVIPHTGTNFLTFTFTVTAPATVGNYTNNATVNYTGTEVTTGNNNASDLTVVSNANTPDMAVSKTHTDPFTSNTNAAYTITLQNVGTGTATPVGGPFQITDTLPNGFQYVSGGGSGNWTCTAPGAGVTQVVCTNSQASLPDASAGAAAILPPLTITVKPGNPTNGTPVNNTVNIQHLPTGDASTANNTDTDPTNVNGIGDLQITKTAAQNFQYNQQGSYTLTVTNIGSATIPGSAATPIRVTDTLASGLTFVAGSGGGGFLCTAVGANVTCDRNTSMPPASGGGTPAVISLNVNVGPLGSFPSGSVTNMAQIAQPTDTNAYGGQNSDTITTPVTNGPAPDLTVTKAHVGSFLVGQQGVYQITVHNSGTAAETGAMTVTDTLNASLTFVSGNSPGGFNCSNVGQLVTCTRPAGNLAGSAQDVITMTVNVSGTASTTTPITNQASVSVNPNDEATTANNTSNTDSVTPTTVPPVSPALSSVCANPSTGLLANFLDTTTVTVTVKDTAGAAMSGVPVLLNMSQNPASMGAVLLFSPNPTNTNASGQATYFVTAANPGTVTFTATVNGITIGANGCTGSATFVATNGLSVANSNLTTNPTPPTTVAADGVATGTITAHIVDNTGANVAGAGVTLTYTTNTGSTTGITLSSTTLTTDSGGNAAFTMKSTTPVTATFSATATFNGQTISLTQHPQLIFGTGGTTVTAVFTFTTNYISIPADNITAATLTASIKDTAGNGISGKTVTVVGNPVLAGMTLSPASAVTDASGNAVFTVRSSVQGGPVTFTATDTTDNKPFPTVQVSFTAPGTKPVAAPNATATPTAGGPADGIVIVRLMCIRTGPGFGYARYGQAIPFNTHVKAMGKTTRVPGTAVRDNCIHKGGPTWLYIQLPDGSIAWANANLIRIGTIAYRNLPILPPPPAPGQPGAGQAATSGLAGTPPKK